MSEIIGVGVLNWDRSERVCDRYGSVNLSRTVESERKIALTVLEGRHGRIIAEVRETRESRHIGDMFRGAYPQKPKIGERIVLGEGTVFGQAGSVGLRPDDGREDLWLDIHALYRAHEQTVALVFEETKKAAKRNPSQKPRKKR